MLDWLNNNKFFKTWIFSTNHKIIGTLYFFFGSFSAYLGVFYSFILRTELATQVRQWFTRNNNFFKVVVAPCVFLGVMLVLNNPVPEEVVHEALNEILLKQPTWERLPFACDNGETILYNFKRCIRAGENIVNCRKELNEELKMYLSKCNHQINADILHYLKNL